MYTLKLLNTNTGFCGSLNNMRSYSSNSEYCLGSKIFSLSCVFIIFILISKLLSCVLYIIYIIYILSLKSTRNFLSYVSIENAITLTNSTTQRIKRNLFNCLNRGESSS